MSNPFRFKKFTRVSTYFALLISALVSNLKGQELIFDFEDGTTQGWATILSDTNVPHVFTPTGALSENGAAFQAPSSGIFQMLPLEFEAPDGTNTRDGAHSTLLIRSPEFHLTEGALSIAIAGGSAHGVLPASPSDLASSTSAGNGLHVQGFGLRRVSDDSYVVTGERSSNARVYENVVVPTATLAEFVSDSETYTLDLFDSYSGFWGWNGFDNVRIPGRLAAGAYFQDFDSFANGATDFADGSTLTTNQVAAVGVTDGSLQLTSDAVTQTRTSFLTPPVSVLASGIRACFDYRLFDAPDETINDVPADGFSFNVGSILPTDSGSEEGFGTGLSIEFDTHLGNGADIIGHNVAVNGVNVPGGANQTDPQVDGEWHAVCIEWIDGAVSVWVDGTALFSEVPTPGFSPDPTDVFAFAGRTGGATETLQIDNIAITIPEPRPTVELVVPRIGFVDFDGVPNLASEFVNAAEIVVPFPSNGGSGERVAHLAHDDDFLYIGATIGTNVGADQDEGREIRLYFDPTFSRTSRPSADHWYLTFNPYAFENDARWYRADESGVFSEVPSPPFEWEVLVRRTGDDANFTFNFEVRVSREFMGTWEEIDGFAILNREPDQGYPGPEDAIANAPSTWARLSYSNDGPSVARVALGGTVFSRQSGFSAQPLAGKEVRLGASGVIYTVETDAAGRFEFDHLLPTGSEINVSVRAGNSMILDDPATTVNGAGIQPIDSNSNPFQGASVRFPACPAGPTCNLARVNFRLLAPPSAPFTSTEIRRQNADVIARDGGGTVAMGDDLTGGIAYQSGANGIAETQAAGGDLQITAVGDGRKFAWPGFDLPSSATGDIGASTIRIAGTNLHYRMKAHMSDSAISFDPANAYELEFISVDPNGRWIDFKLPTLTLSELTGYNYVRLQDVWPSAPGFLDSVIEPFIFREPPYPALRGFGWENGGESSSYDEFLAVYGNSAYLRLCLLGHCTPRVPDPFYHAMWWPIYNLIGPGEDGLCVGMVSTSLLFDQGTIQTEDYRPGVMFPAAWKTKEDSASFRYSGLLGPFSGPPKPVNHLAEIQRNHGVQTSSQFLSSWFSDIAAGPTSVKNEIHSGLSRRVVCFKPAGDWGGHCVAPFDAHRISNNLTLFEMYDPNFETETRYLSVDSGGYRRMGAEAKWENDVLSATPLSIWTGARNHPLNLIGDTGAILYSFVFGAANALHENGQGQQWGWDDSGQFINTMPGAGGIPVFDTPNSERRNTPVTIPMNQGPIKISANSRGGDFSLNTGVGGVAFSLDIPISRLGETDILMTSSAGDGTLELDYRPAVPRAGLRPRLGMEMAEKGSAAFQLVGIAASPGSDTSFMIAAPDRCIEIINGGSSYSVQMDSADAATGRVASLEFGPFAVPGGSRHRLEIANWPTASLLRSMIDADGDGDFESVELVRGRRNPNGLFVKIPGDMNKDGNVNAKDTPILITAVNTPDKFDQLHPNSDFALGDLNADGEVDQLDLDSLLFLIQVGNPLPEIKELELLDGTRVRLEVEGLPGQRYQIQTSRDLEAWEDRGELENISGTVDFLEPIDESGENYYRIRLLD